MRSKRREMAAVLSELNYILRGYQFVSLPAVFILYLEPQMQNVYFVMFPTGLDKKVTISFQFQWDVYLV